MDLVFAAFGLGLAGFDVLGAGVILAAVAAKSSKRSVVVFALTNLVVTVLLGTVLALLLGPSVDNLASMVNNLPDEVWAGVMFVVIVLLFLWAIKRVLAIAQRKNPHEKHQSRLGKFMKYGLFAVGVIFGLFAVVDPSFLALVALAGHDGNVLWIILSFVVWTFASQAPLYVLAVAVLLGKHKKLEKTIERVKAKYGRHFSIAITVVIGLAGVVLLADLVKYLATGSWLI